MHVRQFLAFGALLNSASFLRHWKIHRSNYWDLAWYPSVPQSFQHLPPGTQARLPVYSRVPRIRGSERNYQNRYDYPSQVYLGLWEGCRRVGCGRSNSLKHQMSTGTREGSEKWTIPSIFKNSSTRLGRSKSRGYRPSACTIGWIWAYSDARILTRLFVNWTTKFTLYYMNY